MKTDFLFFTVLLVFASCGGDAAQKDTAPPAPKPEQTPAAPDDRPVIYLEGIYASSNTPAAPVYDLFDNDPNTGWRTREGTGPDEGIMLYFVNALPLQSVQLTPADDSYQNVEQFVQVYVNGVPGNTGKASEKIALGDKLVKALYLRFMKTGLEQKFRRDKDGVNVLFETFPNDAFISIKELNVFNDKGRALRLVPPAQLRGNVTASSTLAPEPAYSPANLFDARKEFAWAEGNKKSAGAGEILSFGFGQEVNITAIQIWNGYQRSDEHFAANVRVRDFEFGAKDAPASSYTLRDTRAGQKIDLRTAIKGQNFELKIKSVYPGRNYQDLAISDIVFYDGAKPFVISSDLPARYTTELHRKAIVSPLHTVLDRRISNVVEEADVVSTQSLILRSDGTFVLYSSNSLPNDTESQTLADGNWELMRADGGSATLRVFGRWNDVSEFAEMYKGVKTKDVTRIFSDELQVDGNIVRGKKMIETFYVR